MKELQSIVNKHFDKLRHKKKYLAMVTALSMLVSFMVPLILTEPADSMTYKKVTLLSDENTTIKIPVTNLGINISGDAENMVSNAAGTSGNIANGVTYTPEKMDIIALLFGGTVDEKGVLKLQDIYEGCKTVEDALEVDKETYFLGFASDFCAFIEGDFTATDADAEGRVAVGGNLRFDWESRKWNYQIGSGDYEVMSPLDEVKWTDDYRNVYGFASALVGGQMFRINTLSTGNSANNKENDRHINGKGDTAYYDPDDGLYKYFLVSNTDGFLHYDEPNDVDVPYDTNCSHDYPGSCAYCSSESGSHAYLDNVNELSQMYIYDGIRDLIKDTFAYIRSRSDTLAQMQSIQGKAVYTYDGKFEKVLFDAAGVPENTKTVYFTIDDWKDEYMKIEFVNIPEGANIVVNCKESGTVKIASDGNGGRKGDVITSINGKIISKEQLNDQDYKDAGNANNHPDSARILYNFYNTPELHIDGCFNGTVLCPYADAYSKKEECTGHLSGALIAKSFYGGLEFGYRPYRGSSDIFGMSSGYEIPVDKLFAGTEKPLPGAMFQIVELEKDKDNSVIGENIISLFESANKTNIISLPTYIDFSGDTYYIAESVISEDGLKEVTNNKFFSEDGVPLSSPLEVYAYKTGNYNDGDLIGNDAIPLQGKFYIKGTQVISLDGVTHESTPVYAYSNSGADRYEVYLSKIITATDSSVTVTVKDAAGTKKSVTVNFIPIGITLTNKPTEAGNPISFQLKNYHPTDGIQFKYYYATDGTNYTEIPNMNGTSGSFTPQSAGTYTIKAQAWYNNKPIAEAVSESVTVSAAKNPYIDMDNESPRVGDSVSLSVQEIPAGYNVTNWYVQNGTINNGIWVPNNSGNWEIKVTISNGTNNRDITKTVYVHEALQPKLLVSSNNAIAGKDTITFNVYDLPNGVTVRWTFGSKSGTGSSGSFVPEELGNRPLYVDLSNGTRLEAWIQVDAPQTDTSQMELVATSVIGGTTNFYKGVKINFSVTGASSSNIQYKILYNDVNDHSQYMDSASSITPSSAGKYTITATVDGVAVPNQVIINIPDYVLTISPSSNSVGQEVSLSVQNIPSSKVTKIDYYIADGNYHLGTDNNPLDSEPFKFNSAQAGDYTVQAVITFDGGGTSSVTASMHTDQVNYNAVQFSAAPIASFSMRSNISVLSAETNVIYDNNKIIITSVGGEYIGRVRLNTLYSNIDYSIKAVLYSGETQISEQLFTKDQIQGNSYWADIICNAADEITKVEVEAVAGSVNIKDCHVTWLEPCQNVVKTYPANGKVSDTESYAIILEEELDPEDFTLKFVDDDNNVNFVLDLYDSDGNKLTYNNGSDGKWTVTDGLFIFSQKGIVLDNNKKLNSDVAKIVISSGDGSKFKVGYYTVSSIVDKDASITTVPTDTVVEEHTYIIREDTAPQGFVKSDKNYKVVINETISLKDGNIEDNRLPKVSNATITIYESVDGATFTEKSDYTSAEKYNKAFEASLEISNDYQKNIRTIKYGDNTFVIERNDSGEVKSFTVNGSDGAAVVQDLNKPQQFEIGEEGSEQRFYYNPVTAMVVPFPAENLEYENAPGLHFQKVDDIGLPVKGADIKLQVKDEDGTYVSNEHTNSVWSWSDKAVQTAIDVSKLDPANIYRFYEETSPAGYESSDPIYFKVVKKSVDEKTKLFIHYAMKEADLDTEGKYTELDIAESRVIRMTDSRILGAKLKLKKVKEDGTTFLDGAVFNLYSDDGTETLIKKDIKVDKENGVEVDLTENVEPNILNYVENGYLKPGMYFLTEATVPNGYKNPGAIKFVVRSDFSIKFIDDNSGGSAADEYIQEITSLALNEADAWGNLKWYSLLVNGNIVMDEPFGKEGAPAIGFANVQKIEVEFGSDTSIEQLYIDSGKYDGSSNDDLKNEVKDGKLILTFDTPRDIYQFKAAASKFSINSIKFTDKKGRVIGWPSTQSGGSDVNETPTPVINHTVDNETDVKILTLGNTPDNGKVDIPIQKLWLNDNSFAAFRPDVIIKLYRTKTEFTDYSSIPEDGEQVTENGNPVQVTLNAGNNWTHTFYNIDSRYQDENDEYKPYYFYLVEESCDGYKTPVYNKKTDGTLTVTNELDSVDIPVVKHLINPDNISAADPKSITLKLQVQVGEDEWATVEGKTITLSPECDWKGTITGLLRGKKYRLTEDAVVGWEIDKESQEVITINTTSPDAITDKDDLDNDIIATLELTNKPKKPDEGSIQLEKDWNTTEDLPSSVYFKLFRVAKKFYPPQTVEQVQQDYARLLQYSLYFYDANMCGDDVGEKSALPWRDICHDEDAINGVAGGYHDAGDHVMFGLPQGYSATMLGWSLYEFNTTAPDGEKVYDNLNQTAHYKIISDRFNDFFAECIRVNEETGKTEILVQKGDGDIDHKLWGAPETQQDRTNEMIWSDKGSDIAAEYAASLALSYLNFYRDDLPEAEKTKYKNHLAAAKKLYDFATTANREKYSNTFYPSNSDNDDKALAAGWLYLATVKEGSAVDRYRDECNVTQTNAITWDEVHIAAACVKAHIDGNWDSVANNYANVSAETGICYNTANTYYEGPHKWGTARHNALSQTVALAIAKNLKENNPTDARAQKIADWCKTQMNFILGGNNWKDGSPVCLVTGFSEISTKYAHHRAASGWDDHEAYKINPTYDSDGHIIIGALAGGPAFKGHDDQQQMKDYGHDNCVANHTYLDDLHDYCCNEVALDYNAGLVGAAAGLYYFFETGHTYEIPGVEVQYLQPEDEEVSVPANMFSTFSVRLGEGIDALAYEGEMDYHEIVYNQKFYKGQEVHETFETEYPNIVQIEVIAESDNIQTSFNGWDIQPSQSSPHIKVLDNPTTIKDFFYRNMWDKESIDSITIRLYYPRIGVSITNTKKELAEGDSVELTSSGATGTVTWNLSDGAPANVRKDETTNKWYLDINDVQSETAFDVTVTDTPNDGSEAKTKTVTFKALPLTISGNQEMSKNKTQQLAINSVMGMSSFDWSIPQEQQQYATVDSNGIVTAHSAGNVTVKATSKHQNGAYTATFTITVTEQQESLTLGIDNGEININAETYLRPDPSDNVSYSYTGNQDGLQIDNSSGKVTGLKAGTYTITASRNNGSQTKTINLTVREMSLNTPTTEITVGGSGTQWSINNQAYNSSINWESENTSVATVDGNGNITAVSAGDAVIKATVSYNGNNVTFRNTIKVTGNSSSGGESGGGSTSSQYPLLDTITPSNGQTEFTSLDYDNVKKIEIVFLENASGNGCNVVINGGYSWMSPSGGVIEILYDDVISVSEIAIRDIQISPSDLIEIRIYSGIIPPAITGATTVMVGNTIDFKAENFDGTDITWSVVASDGGETNLATIDQNGKLTANGVGTVKVVATRGSGDDAQTANATVTIIQFDFGFDSDSSDFKVHVGKELTIPFDTDRNVTMTITGTNNGNVELNGNTFKGLASTEGQKIGFEATCSGKTITGTIEVVPDLSISGESKTYTGRKLQLTANNAVGNVIWSIDAGETEAKISQSGVLTAGGKAGTVKVQVTDDEMTSEIFEIVIQPGCAEVDIEGLTDITYKFAEEGKNVIELTAADNWSKLLSGLEVYDANRDYYCYYIVECDADGIPITNGSHVMGSNGAMFVPTSYKNNGATIEKGQTSKIEVSNALSAKVEGQMPSTGGDGTTTYYCFGAFIMLLSAAGFIGLKRRQRSQRSE